MISQGNLFSALSHLPCFQHTSRHSAGEICPLKPHAPSFLDFASASAASLAGSR